MTARALAAVLALASIARPAAAQTARGIDQMAVTYRSATSVYVSGGRAAGLVVGDRLNVVSGRETVAELEVAFLAEHSASCKIIGETGTVKTGDRVVRIGPPRAAAPSPAPSAAPGSATPPAAPPPSYPGDAARRRGNGYGRLTGGLTLGYGGFWDASPSSRDLTELSARYDLAARDVAGQPIELRVRGTHRQVDRTGTRGVILTNKDTRDRLYEASVAYAPMKGRVAATVGRLGAHPFVSLGYLDGALAEVRPTSNIQVGAFGGNTIEMGGPAGGTKAGGFLRFAPLATRMHYEVVVSGVHENRDGDVSRDYLGLQGQLRTGEWWLYQRAEVDLNRGWREEKAGTTTQFSDVRSLLNWRPSPTRSVSFSYERRQNYWTSFNRTLPTEAFDDRVMQTFRADIDLARANTGGVWTGGSVRLLEGDDRTVYDVHGGFRTPRFLSMRTSIEATLYRTATTLGIQGTARIGRDLEGGHRIDASYNFNGYDMRGDEGNHQSQWFRLSGYGQFARGAFARADLEYGFGNDLEGVRVLLEGGYRF
jgi:hypothetical protein